MARKSTITDMIYIGTEKGLPKEAKAFFKKNNIQARLLKGYAKYPDDENRRIKLTGTKKDLKKWTDHE